MRHAVAAVALFSLLFFLAPYSHGDSVSIHPIISIANSTSCSGTPPGGTICSNGVGGLEGTGGTAFSLKAIESGSITLQAVIGTQTAPVYEVINDTGASITKITLVLSGFLQTNEFLDCQTHGAFSGDSCTVTPALSGVAGCTSSDANASKTQDNPCLPVKIVFTGLNISAGSTFDITFASFGNNASGGVTGVTVPEPSSLTLLGTGILGLAAFARRKLNLAIEDRSPMQARRGFFSGCVFCLFERSPAGCSYSPQHQFRRMRNDAQFLLANASNTAARTLVLRK